MTQPLVLKLMKWVRKYYYKGTSPNLAAFTRQAIHLFFLWGKTKGWKWTATAFKLSRLAITRTLAGQELPRPFGISLCKRTNLPMMLPLQVRLGILRKDFLLISYVLTVLQLSRLILGTGVIDSYDSITRPCSGSNPFTGASVAIVMNRMGISRLDEPTSFTFPWCSTSGPNGVSIATSFSDLMHIPQDLLECLFTLGGPEFKEKVSSLKGFVETTNGILWKLTKLNPDKTGNLLRRISIKKDKEYKSRPFAIVDYITQSALTPLHDRLYRVLKSIPQDCTFDQNKGFKDLLYGGGPYYSFDLTSATDRFPIFVQEMVLAWLTSEQYATAWVQAMVDLPFDTPGGPRVKFECGQPLGAKSSWAMFTLSHHFVVQYCAMVLNIDSPRYKILGDDIVICDHALAAKYLEVMSQLGVEISPVKTHVSENLFEFAKRFGLQSVEISSFPITALISDINNYVSIVATLATTAVERGNLPLFVSGNTPRFWESLLKIGKEDKPRLVNSLVHSAKLLSYLLMSNKPYLVAQSDLLRFAEAAGFGGLAIPQVFAAYKRAVLYMKDREIDKLADMSMRFIRPVQSMLSQIMFLPWRGRVSVDYRRFIPIIDSIDSNKELYVSFRKEFEEANDLVTLNQVLDDHPIRPMPNLNGLQPNRPKLLVGQTRAALIKALVKELTMLAKGEEPK
uniref:RNA-dependent RNA polymerase n=1 Tax=Sclerotinia sclerotiorum mitovirus 17 TaxID=1708326 RepID=A0A0M3SUN3_9VIRU|nr:RNA-dependent RNA polymerase [Sclerotinia sclerotiorum mitovirus 17]